MALFQPVVYGFWRDKRIRSLTEDGRTLALYALTCNDRSTEGFYALSAHIGAHDLQWEPDRWDKAWSDLADKGFAEYDPEAEVVLIEKGLKHHPPRGQTADGQKGQIPGAVNRVSATQQSPELFARFLASADKRAGDFAKALRKRYGLTEKPDELDPFAE